MTKTAGFEGKSYTEFRPQHNEGFFKHVLERAQLRPGNIIADIGAGNGNSSIPLLKLGYKVIAIEHEASMLAKLRSAVADKPYANHLYVIPKELEKITKQDMEAAATFLGSEQGKADAIFAASSLHWLDRKVALPVLRENIVKPDGKIIGVSRLMDPHHLAVVKLHAFLTKNTPGYKTAETTFSPDRWSNVEKQAARYMESGFYTATLEEKRLFHNFDEFKGYLQTVSSLREWLEKLKPDSPQFKQLQALYEAHAKQGEFTLPWKYIACIGDIQTRTLPDPFPAPQKLP